ncbi:MAG: T9SS type A sorting domain-containing protein [Bacteroidales bacterium]|nr:T9SS type A sorting domain-containing protein [Bacteroidales bacterium]
MKRILLLIISCILFAFTIGDSKSIYTLPLQAYSVYSEDIDLDGDNDIVVGHKYSSQTGWGGVSILENDGNGYLQLTDSLFVENGYPFVHCDNLDNNEYPDIFSIHVTANPYTVFAGIIYNYGEVQFDSIKSFIINYDEMVDYITSGDVNGDGFNDIVFAANTDKIWGMIYNNGTGNFSAPEYSNLESWPTDINCADLNGDGKDDVVIACTHIKIYYANDTGFQYQEIPEIALETELADADNDGDIDIVVIAGFITTQLSIYENMGNQNFVHHSIAPYQPQSGELRLSDFNNDSLPEIITGSLSDFYISYNTGNNTYSPPQILTPTSFGELGRHYCFSDIDNNGYNDVIFTRGGVNFYIPNLEILFNDGNGNFVEDPITNIEIPNPKYRKINLKCFPNPVHSFATVEFELAVSSIINMVLIDFSGKPVKQLLNGELIPSGLHTIPLEAGKFPKGVYFIKLEINKTLSQSIKIIIN